MDPVVGTYLDRHVSFSCKASECRIGYTDIGREDSLSKSEWKNTSRQLNEGYEEEEEEDVGWLER